MNREHFRYDYVGDGICFEEMPQGCVISRTIPGGDGEIVVSTTKDALALIASLTELISYNLSQEVKDEK